MSEDPFEKLLLQLEQEEWPQTYLFKFISPGDEKTIAMVVALFENQNEIAFRPSKNGNFTSITVKEVMLSAKEVIEIYRKASTIKGVITL